MSQYPTNPTDHTAQPSGSGQLVMIGCAVAAVAVIMMNIYVEMRVAAAQEDEITVYQFVGDLEAGDEIESSDLIEIQIPLKYENAFGQDAIRENPTSPGKPSDGIGFKLNVSVVGGEVLRSSQFTGAGRRVGRNDPEKGKFQIALSVDSDDQPSDLAPGDRINLYGAIRRSRSTEYMVVMEYVEVAAVGERRSESGDGSRSNKYGSITINIKPEQVPKIFDIQQRLPDQEFRISLRPASDTSTPKTGGDAINPEVLQALGMD